MQKVEPWRLRQRGTTLEITFAEGFDPEAFGEAELWMRFRERLQDFRITSIVTFVDIAASFDDEAYKQWAEAARIADSANVEQWVVVADESKQSQLRAALTEADLTVMLTESVTKARNWLSTYR